jgi:hypothetical protein
MFLAKAKRPNEMKEKGACASAELGADIDLIKALEKHPPLCAPQAQTG